MDCESFQLISSEKWDIETMLVKGRLQSNDK